VKPCCNIDRTGRIFRVVLGAVFVVNAGAMFWMEIPNGQWTGLLVQFLLGAFGAFSLYEGSVGWCAARALGIRTRI
jgi:hypothetical protein